MPIVPLESLDLEGEEETRVVGKVSRDILSRVESEKLVVGVIQCSKKVGGVEAFSISGS